MRSPQQCKPTMQTPTGLLVHPVCVCVCACVCVCVCDEGHSMFPVQATSVSTSQLFFFLELYLVNVPGVLIASVVQHWNHPQLAGW